MTLDCHTLAPAAICAVLALLVFVTTARGGADNVPPSPAPQPELAPMLRITWSRGPNLPQGFQDSDGGFLGTQLITVGGFCQGADDARKPGRYPRGFLNKVWAFDIAAPAKGWVSLPDYPATPRQGLMAVPVNGALYCWGGFNYTPPNCYADGYRLSRSNGQWVWDQLPPLPWPLTASGICAIGHKIYVFGGGDYSEDFRTDADRNGNNPRLGARLIVFDTENVEAGWKRLTDCPGTPRLGVAMAAVGGKIYVLGGVAATPRNSGSIYRSIVDNWRYDPARDSWERIRDLPTSSSNFPDGKIVVADRYVLLVGGFPYAEVANPDGTFRPPYGHPHKFADQGEYYNDVFVYDTKTDLFGTADPLPINNAGPMTVVHGNEIFLVGGETDAREIDGEYYGHHPDLFLRGQIEASSRRMRPGGNSRGGDR
jgi:N-acetylneuraminic acid mutarotase